MPTPSALDLASLRRNYALRSLSEHDVLPDPVEQFQRWFAEALDSQLHEPNAMTLATVNADGQPSARIVLLKNVDSLGFTFFTNYESHKAADLAAQPRAALLFAWLDLERQVRIEGAVEKIDAETSRDYFQSRPRGSQIGAWASPQSRPVADRSVLENAVAALERDYAGQATLPLPPFWGGYRVLPARIEFWQGRENRLHDRILYTREGEGWRIERLAP